MRMAISLSLLMRTVTSRRTGSFASRVHVHLLPFIKFLPHLISFGADLCRARVAAHLRGWERCGVKAARKVNLSRLPLTVAEMEPRVSVNRVSDGDKSLRAAATLTTRSLHGRSHNLKRNQVK